MRTPRYQTVADSADTKGIAPPQNWTVPDVEAWLLAHTASLKSNEQISPIKSVFEQGFDRCVRWRFFAETVADGASS